MSNSTPRTTPTVRQHETESETESTDETTRCPECSGQLITDEEHGETVCRECGLVVESDEIDRGPEWRAFDSAERDSKSRVGAPTTNMMHDKGLSTNIGWQDKDAYGKSLSSNQRQKMQRAPGTSGSAPGIARSATSNRPSARSIGWPRRWVSRRPSARRPR